MSTPLPVPSKVAVTAIRGLIVGTSCSLVLITEDRRRRINHARNAIHNAQRIKSARNYHSGGGELAVALEEEALLESGLLHGIAQRDPRGAATNHSDGWARRAQTEPARDNREAKPSGRSHARKHETAGAADGDSPRRKAVLSFDESPKWTAGYRPISQPQPRDHFRRFLTDSERTCREQATSFVAFPNREDMLAFVHTSAADKLPQQIDVAVSLMREALSIVKAPRDPDQPLLGAAASLCRACRDLGRPRDAGELLRSIFASWPLGEEQYYSFDPLPLIDGLLADISSTSYDHASARDAMRLATALYLPDFTEKPRLAKPEAFDIGRRLLAAAFATRQLQHVDELYWRCLVHRQNDFEFVGWFIRSLSEADQHKSVVKYFLLCYSKMQPSQGSIQSVGDIVVESVAAAGHSKAQQVLRTLRELCSGTCLVKTAWVIRLLSSHWQRHHEFEKTEQIFRSLRDADLQSIVPHTDGVYRIMVEIALKAGRPETAGSYFDEIVKERPGLASDVRLLGLIAQHRAAVGDWDGVWERFKAMRADSKDASEARGEVFVPILKIYGHHHTVKETESFLRAYVDELQVPIVSYTVTLMANHYGAVRDARSLVQWLSYCAHSGFKVDAAFSNAILANCRRRWHLPYMDLRKMFRTLRGLCPEFANESTEHMMVHAALSQPRSDVRCAVGRVYALRVNPDKVARKGKCANERDVVLAMKQQLTFGHPGQSLRLYKRALHLGMPFSSYALRLAVQASLKVYADNYDAAYSLIRRARRGGEDVGAAAVPILAAQIRHINAGLAKEERPQAIREALAQLRDEQISVSDVVLNLAALSCLRAGRAEEAIQYALGAARALEDAQPCYNVYNFTVLLWAYADLGDVHSLRWVIQRARSSDYWTKKRCLSALKWAKKRLGPSGAEDQTEADVSAAWVLVSAAREEVLSARQEFDKERQRFQEEVIGIMRNAAGGSAAPEELGDPPPLDIRLADELPDSEFEELGFGDGGEAEADGVVAHDLAPRASDYGIRTSDYGKPPAVVEQRQRQRQRQRNLLVQSVAG